MKKTIKFIVLIIFSLVALSVFSKVEAATATISANKTTATVGDSVKVTVSINAASWNLNVSGSASGTIVGYNGDAENQKTTKTYTINTSKAGTYKVLVSGDITDGITDVNSKVSKSVSITVKEKAATSNTTNNQTSTTTKSSNANLKTLGVTPKEYDFSGFSKSKTSYNITVPSTVDSLTVIAKAEDSKAKVKVSGNSGFDVGSNNKIKVVVTAEDGKTTKTYTIKVTKLATDEELPGNVIEDEKKIYLTSLSLEGLELTPEFSKDVYSYTAKLSSADINQVKVNAVANNEKANIEISGNEGLVEGENTINIILTLEGSTEQTVYQITINKQGQTIAATSEKEGLLNTLMQNWKKYALIAIIIFILIILAIIVLICLIKKENKKLNNEENDLEDEEDHEEYNVYKNDIDEFTDNNTQTDNFIKSLYEQRNGNIDKEELNEQEKETLEEIKKQTENIFTDKVQGQNVEYNKEEPYDENPLEERRKRRGRHF